VSALTTPTTAALAVSRRRPRRLPPSDRVSLKTDRTTAQQTAQLDGDDNMHA